MAWTLRSVALGLVLGALAGCGGGRRSPDGRPAPVESWEPVVIDVTNAESIASVVWLDNAATEADDLIPSEVTASLVRFMPLLASRPNDLAMDVSCPHGGGVSVAGTVGQLDEPGWSIGDSATLRYDGCVAPEGLGIESITDGGFAMSVPSVTTDGRTIVARADGLATALGQWGTFTQDGEVTIDQSRDARSTKVSLDRFTVDHDGSLDVAEDFIVTLDEAGTAEDARFVLAFRGTRAGDGFGGSVAVDTPVPFAGLASGYPSRGQMVITGAGGSSVTLTAQADAVSVLLVVNGGAPVEMTWEALEE